MKRREFLATLAATSLGTSASFAVAEESMALPPNPFIGGPYVSMMFTREAYLQHVFLELAPPGWNVVLIDDSHGNGAMFEITFEKTWGKKSDLQDLSGFAIHATTVIDLEVLMVLKDTENPALAPYLPIPEGANVELVRRNRRR